jgi:hypothetical protein
MVMRRHGYETALKGKNGFVCLVERSWTTGIDDPDFCNPRLRAPICFNPPAARTYLPLTNKKTESVLAGRSKAQMFEDRSETRPAGNHQYGKAPDIKRGTPVPQTLSLQNHRGQADQVLPSRVTGQVEHRACCLWKPRTHALSVILVRSRPQCEQVYDRPSLVAAMSREHQPFPCAPGEKLWHLTHGH